MLNKMHVQYYPGKMSVFIENPLSKWHECGLLNHKAPRYGYVGISLHFGIICESAHQRHALGPEAFVLQQNANLPLTLC